MRNWLDMSPEEFDVSATSTLFDLPMTATAPASDGCGTADLFADLTPEEDQ